MKQIKKGIVYTLAGSMLFSSISPAFAYTYKDSEPSFTVQDVNEDKTSNTTVYAEIGSAFEVTIPKHIILDGTTKSGAYTVNVTGDIAGTEVVSVVPDKSFALKSNFLNDVTATITQDKTEWSYDQILNDEFKVIGNGAINAKDITAGSWNGNFNFNIKLENNLVNQKGLILSVNDNVTLGIEDSLQVDAYINGVKSNDVVAWESNNENITVNNGLIETKASAQVGDTATITVTTQDQTELTTIQTALSDLGLVTYASATDDLSIDFVVTIVDIEYSVDELNLKAGESIDVTAKIIPEDINGTVSWSQTAITGINLVKNGNTVTIKVADNMEVGKSYDLIATYGNYSKTLKINIINESNNEERNPETLEAGLYDTNGVMLCTWEESGIDASISYGEYSSNSNYYKTTTSSPYYVLTNNYPTATKIVLPASTTNIGNFAFYNCTNLFDIKIPNGVTNIGESAFESCTSLFSVKIPSSVINIGNVAFYNCTSLFNVEFSNGLINIGDNAFRNCKNLTGELIFPDSVASIGTAAFANCSKIVNVTIPESVTNIGFNVFSGCTGTLTVNCDITSGTSTSSGAFTDCNFTSAIINGNIGDYAFSGSDLSDVVIGNNVTSIGSCAFQYSYDLCNVTMGNNVKDIKYCAFAVCSSLSNITIPESVTNIEKSAFYSTNLTNATFEDTNTWYVGSSAGATTTTLASSDLSNTSTAATYLKSTHYSKYWTKK